MGKMLATFTKGLNLEFEKIKRIEVEALKFAVEVTYDIIQQRWPRLTYYSLANHRINIGGGEVLRVEPTKRPNGEGALAGKAASVRASELAKLKDIKFKKDGQTIIIGNAVDYAPNVGRINGNGLAIYREAASQAKAILDQGIGKEKF